MENKTSRMTVFVTIVGFTVLLFVIQNAEIHENSSGLNHLVREPPDVVLSSFGYIEYQNESYHRPVEMDNCFVLNTLEPNFHICTYYKTQDYASKELVNGRGYETKLSSLVSKAMANCGQDTIFVDLGANIGVHSLYMAKQGYQVYAVEPQVLNLVKLYHSSMLESTNSNMRLFRHAIDQERRKVVIRQTYGNIGGSFVSSEENLGRKAQFPAFKITSVLLGDIMDQVAYDLFEGSKMNIVIKLDIENYECRALLGSPEIFHDSRYFIPYVFLEWKFSQRNDKNPHACPSSMRMALVKMISSNGYQILNFDLEPQELEHLDNWGPNIILIHNDAKPLKR